MPTGIAQESCVNEYVAKVSELIREWDTPPASSTVTTTANQNTRAVRLLMAVQTQLNKFNIPWPDFGWEEMEKANGLFDFRIWRVKLKTSNWTKRAPRALEGQTAFKKGVAKLADTVYHEHRHCEQWFRMARFLSTNRKNADQISAAMGIEKKIAEEAAKLPPLIGEELDEGKAWYEGVYGRPTAQKTGVATATAIGGFNQRDLVHTAGKLRHVERQPAVVKSEKANVQEEELASISSNRRMTAYLQYRNLVEEADAFDVGTAVQRALYRAEGLEGVPEPPKHTGVRESVTPNVTNV
jgi:hypothetical protein